MESGKKFACKVLSRETDLNVICNEIEIINKLQHRNIFELVGIVHDPKFVYLIQSYYINGTLKHLLKHRRIISIAECRYFIHQILCGTQYIHSKNIIHRDLKLANIFIDEHMQLKIGDFGLAINITDVEADRYHICGTIRYLSPEVLNHNGFSFKSDVWAIGVMMYNLIVGTSPFDGDNVKMTAKLIRKMNYRLGFTNHSIMNVFFFFCYCFNRFDFVNSLLQFAGQYGCRSGDNDKRHFQRNHRSTKRNAMPSNEIHCK